jgi:CTP:molybdopterin cytidylyltransferase MocA
MLVKDAPARTALEQVVRYLLITASYARRDVVRPMVGGHRPRPTIVRRRLRAFAGFLRLLGPMVGARRHLRQRQLVADRDLQGWWQQR